MHVGAQCLGRALPVPVRPDVGVDVGRKGIPLRVYGRDELDGDHYETFVVKNPNGTESQAIKMTRDQCMYVLMRESKAVRRAVTNRLNVLEAPSVPQTLPEALRLAADLAEQKAEVERQKLALETKVAEQSPKVEALERFADQDGKHGVRTAAKLLGLPERKLISWLLTHDWYYRDHSKIRATADSKASPSRGSAARSLVMTKARRDSTLSIRSAITPLALS